jgi:hypothetical protein
MLFQGEGKRLGGRKGRKRVRLAAVGLSYRLSSPELGVVLPSSSLFPRYLLIRLSSVK